MNGQSPEHIGQPPPVTEPGRHPAADRVTSTGSANPHHRPPATITGDHQLITAMLLVSCEDISTVRAVFRYRCIDPFAVHLRLFVDQCQTVTWILSRELLAAGLTRPSGVGDVRIYPGGDGALIELRSTTDAHAVLLADRRPIQQFVDHTMSIVPSGSEIALYDIDADLTRLTTGRHPPHRT